MFFSDICLISSSGRHARTEQSWCLLDISLGVRERTVTYQADGERWFSGQWSSRQTSSKANAGVGFLPSLKITLALSIVGNLRTWLSELFCIVICCSVCYHVHASCFCRFTWLRVSNSRFCVVSEYLAWFLRCVFIVRICFSFIHSFITIYKAHYMSAMPNQKVAPVFGSQ